MVRPWVGLLACLVGCDAITQPAPSPAPVNVCGGASHATCARYPADAGVSCATAFDAGACQTGTPGPLPFLLVVTIPSLATANAGETFVIPSGTLFSSSATACTGGPVPLPDVCYQFPRLVTVDGVYVIQPGQAATTGVSVGSVGMADVSLPVAVTFWPQWLAPGSATVTDARYLNLPLPPVVANVNEGEPINTGIMANAPGGGNGTQIDWLAGVPPLPASPAYQAVVQVDAPFDRGYSDQSYGVTTTPSGANQSVVLGEVAAGGTPDSLSTEPPSGPLTVTRTDGSPLGTGWSVYFRDRTTLNAVSSRATLGPTDTTARLYVFGSLLPIFAASGTVEFVMDPPASGTGQPQFVDVAPNGMTELYPLLPPLVHLTGTVRSPENTLVSATLLFYSSSLGTCAAAEEAGSAASTLFYEVPVRTDDQVSPGGSVGHFEVDLPQGSYALVTEPTLESGYAKTRFEYLDVPVNGTTCARTSPTDDTVIRVDHPINVAGSFVTADGRPLANAEVDFTPAAALASGLDPSLSVSTAPFFTLTARDLWPRPVTVSTGAEGGFSAALEPAQQYDLTVRPQNGTNFPWVVRANHVFEADMAPLGVITVPAPFVLSVTLEDPMGNAVANAVVEAYAFSDQVTPPSSQVAVLIGNALTDTNGHFTMSLTTAFPSN